MYNKMPSIHSKFKYMVCNAGGYVYAHITEPTLETFHWAKNGESLELPDITFAGNWKKSLISL